MQYSWAVSESLVAFMHNVQSVRKECGMILNYAREDSKAMMALL
jgi:hypothetical protein